MKVLVFAASSSRRSINRALARHAAARLRDELLPDLTLVELDLNDYDLPVYSIDREQAEGVPEAARRFLAEIGAAEGILISYAEHNGLYTAAFKNVFDWASRLNAKVFQAKPTLALATSPGARGGAGVLKAAQGSAPHYGAELVGSLSVPKFHEAFDGESGALRDPVLAAQLGAQLARFADRLRRDPNAAPPAPPPAAAFWDGRYAEAHLAYGTEPNAFVAAVAGRVPQGPVLVLAAGEGRDAVFFAGRGHAVTAVDLSEVGLRHAADLAERRGLSLQTVVADLADYALGEAQWSGIIATWAHLPPPLRAKVHAACVRALRPGGVLILEAYRPEHLDMPGRGGPPVAAMLFDAATARRELDGLEFELCQDVQRHVAEGRDHEGLSATVQVLARRR